MRYSVLVKLFRSTVTNRAELGFLLTLYPAENLVKESKKYGVYHNNYLDRDFSKIQIVSVEEILKGYRLPIPITMQANVLKAAAENAEDNQQKLF